MAVEWTQELKDKVIKEYVDAEPTPENSMEIVKEVAEANDVTPNGARNIISRAGKYVKKAPAAKSASSTASGASKESKADSLKRLTDVISANGATADDTIISKLTGKAAAYFADTFESLTPVED